MARNKEYKKLPGRGARSEGLRFIAATRNSCRLWLGSDHLLLILTTFYNEEFKRFYFSDIQALTVRKTKNGFVLNAVLIGIASLFIVFGIYVPQPIARWILVGIGGALLLFAFINFLFGPTCIAEIKTAVQTEELSSLKRIRTARKVLNQLRPIIQQAQTVAPPPLTDAPLEVTPTNL